MIPGFSKSLLLAMSIVSQLAHTVFPQEPSTIPKIQSSAYSNTSEGLKELIGEILRAIKAKDSRKENELIRGLVLPTNSKWLTEEYGPGFGANLATAYRKLEPGLEQEIKTIYEGNVERGWITPGIRRYTEPESVNAPIDQFLNCMDQIVPLYQTNFKGDSAELFFSQKPGENGMQVAGDLDGYFIYDQGAFRFIPIEILLKLPRERPVRIRLDMYVMRSKISNEVRVKVPLEAIKKHISGQVVVQLVLDIGGSIKESKVLEGNPILSAAVMDAVRQWKFAPTTLDGDPVEVVLEIPMEFNLR